MILQPISCKPGFVLKPRVKMCIYVIIVETGPALCQSAKVSKGNITEAQVCVTLHIVVSEHIEKAFRHHFRPKQIPSWHVRWAGGGECESQGTCSRPDSQALTQVTICEKEIKTRKKEEERMTMTQVRDSNCHVLIN